MREERLSPDELAHVNSYRLLEKVMQKRKGTTTPEEMYALYHQLLQKSQMYKSIANKQAEQRESGSVTRVIEPTVRTVQSTTALASVTPPPTPRTQRKVTKAKTLRKRLGIDSTVEVSPSSRKILRPRRRLSQSGGVFMKWCSLPKPRGR